MKIAVEQISKYHPDKYADAISDEILKDILEKDENALCGIETMVKDDKVIIGGEVSTTISDIVLSGIVYFAVERVAKRLNYKVDETYNFLGKQSPQINKAVLGDDIGAGDQGIVVGYANRAEIDRNFKSSYQAKMLADDIIATLEYHTEQKTKAYQLKGDSKCQVMYDKKTCEITEVVVSACHSEEIEFEIFKNNLTKLIKIMLKGRFENIDDIKITVNRAGKWTIGGPTADCGLTGRKLVCDFYGPQVPIGGGAQSGKDLTKVDRSAAIVARYIALDILRKNSYYNDVKVEISYVIGESTPTSVNVIVDHALKNHYDTRHIELYVKNAYDLTPKGLIEFIKLNNIDIYGRVGQLK